MVNKLLFSLLFYYNPILGNTPCPSTAIYQYAEDDSECGEPPCRKRKYDIVTLRDYKHDERIEIACQGS